MLCVQLRGIVDGIDSLCYSCNHSGVRRHLPLSGILYYTAKSAHLTAYRRTRQLKDALGYLHQETVHDGDGTINRLTESSMLSFLGEQEESVI